MAHPALVTLSGTRTGPGTDQASVVSPCWWCEESGAATLAACGSVKVRKYSNYKKVKTNWDM